MVGNGYVGIYTDTTVFEFVASYLWVKLHTSAELRIYSNSPCPRYWASYGVVSQLVFTMGWASVSCFGIVSGSCAMCYDGRGVR